MSSLGSQWSLTEEDVQKLKRQVVTFGEEWAAFGNRSVNWFNDFRTKGASFPDQFFDQLGDLEHRKRLLRDEIAKATNSVPAEVWNLPEEVDSVQEIVASLQTLKEHCRVQEQKTRDRVHTLSATLETLSLLKSDAKEISESLSDLVERSQRLAASVIQMDRQAIEAAENADAAHVSLLRLVKEAQSLARSDGKDAAASLMQMPECADCFDAVDSQFGRFLAIAALRGQVWLSSSAQSNSTQSNSPPENTPRSNAARPNTTAAVGLPVASGEPPIVDAPRLTAEQVSLLQQRFHQPHDKIDAKRSLRRVQPVRRPMVSALEAEGSLRTAIDGLRQRSDQLKVDDPIGAHNAEHPVYQAVIAFDNLVRITEHIVRILDARDTSKKGYRNELEETATLLAEAQNAVRTVADRSLANLSFISEQQTIFTWLKQFVSEEMESIHVKRFMRMDENAEPSNGDNLATRIQGVVEKWSKTHAAAQQLSKIETLVKELMNCGDASTLMKLDKWIQLYVRSSAPVTDAMLRELLMPAVHLLPDAEEPPTKGQPDITDEFRLVLRNIDAHIDQLTERDLEADLANDDTEVSPEVEQVRRWLTGKRVAMVAGTPKPEHQKRIEDAFQLKELKWLEASKTDRVSELSSQVGDVDLIILITKIIGHKHNELRGFCTQVQIPWVQTKKSQGFGVNTLATVITEQASEKLQRIA